MSSKKLETENKVIFSVLRIWIRDPVPPLDLGSVIGFFPDPTITSETLRTFFWGVKILQFCADLHKYFYVPVEKVVHMQEGRTH